MTVAAGWEKAGCESLAPVGTVHAFEQYPGFNILAREEIIVIALTAAATFAILDVFIPAMGSSARGGAGFGIGANLVGGLKLA